MKDISLYLSAVKPYIISQYTCSTFPNEINGIMPLDWSKTYQQNILYVADANNEHIMQQLQQPRKEPAVIFVACPSGEVPDVNLSSTQCIYFLNLTSEALFFRLNELHQFSVTLNTLLRTVSLNQNHPSDLFHLLLEQLQISSFALDIHNRLVYGIHPDTPAASLDPYSRLLLEQGRLSNQDLDRLGLCTNKPCYCKADNLSYYFDAAAQQQNTLSLLLFSRVYTVTHLRFVAEKLASYLTNWLKHHHHQERVPLYTPVFHILDGTIHEYKHVLQALKIEGPDIRLGIAVFRFKDNQTPVEAYHTLSEQIRPFFKCNVTSCIYDQQLVCLFPTSFCGTLKQFIATAFGGQETLDALEAVLKQNRARGCLKRPMSDFLFLSMYYQMLNETFDIASALDPSKTLYFFSDYKFYLLTSYGAKHLANQFEYHRYGAFLNSDFITLIRYDISEQDNLTEVVNKYLSFNGDINRTASALFMHRNTVYRKIKKAEELIETCLDSPEISKQFGASMMIYRYIDEVLGCGREILYPTQPPQS